MKLTNLSAVRVAFVLPILLASLFLFASHLAAQSLDVSGTDTPPADVVLPEPLTQDAARDLIARLSDAEVRELLLQRLDSVAAEQDGSQNGASLADGIAAIARGLYTPSVVAIQRLPILFSSQMESFRNFSQKLGSDGLLRLFGFMALAILAGLVVEQLINRLTRNWQTGRLEARADSLAATLGFLVRRLFIEVVGLIAFVIVMVAVTRLTLSGTELDIARYFLTVLVFLPRVGAAFSRFMLAPNKPEVRIINVDDDWARWLHRRQIALFVLICFSGFIVTFNSLNGVPMGQTRLGFWLNASVHIFVAYVAYRSRHALVGMMRGRDTDITPFDEAIARVYPWFCMGAALFTWMLVNIVVSFENFALLQRNPHYVTMFLLIMAPALDTAVRGVVRHVVPPMQGEGPVAERAYYATKRSYIRIGRVLVIATVILLITNAWQIDLTNLAAAGVGARIAGRLVEFLMAIAFGYLVWELVSLWINRKLAAEQTALGDADVEEFGGDGGGAGGSRLSTVLPLVLLTARIVIAVVFALLALGSLGIDTTPLLAGAGIAGLAIGFGAQKLVTDVVSGVFFLVDDAFRTGEYVEVDGTMGTVEKISIRSMQLRHHKGPVHTIPYGEIPKLTNYSRDWVIMKLKFTVPFETDPNKIKKIFKKIGQDLLQDEILGEDFLQPFKSQGVFEIDEVGMVVRGKFMAKPGKQFMIRKEIFNRVKAAFAENGIDFARREVRVALPDANGLEELSDEDKATIAAAASQAAQEQPGAAGGTPDDR
ncbi:MAG: mechanosensitive ion channel domain-containing protein [Pseudomonadota bacterium]